MTGGKVSIVDERERENPKASGRVQSLQNEEQTRART